MWFRTLPTFHDVARRLADQSHCYWNNLFTAMVACLPGKPKSSQTFSSRCKMRPACGARAVRLVNIRNGCKRDLSHVGLERIPTKTDSVGSGFQAILSYPFLSASSGGKELGRATTEGGGRESGDRALATCVHGHIELSNGCSRQVWRNCHCKHRRRQSSSIDQNALRNHLAPMSYVQGLCGLCVYKAYRNVRKVAGTHRHRCWRGFQGVALQDKAVKSYELLTVIRPVGSALLWEC